MMPARVPARAYAAAMPIGGVPVALGWVFVAGLCGAALLTILALGDDALGDTDRRLIASSVSFAVFSALAVSGIGLRARRLGRTLAVLTVTSAAAAWALLLGTLWPRPSYSGLYLFDVPIREAGLLFAWLYLTVIALAASHASLVARFARADDTRLIRTLVAVSIVLALGEATVGVVVVGLLFAEDGPAVRVWAITLVLLALTTALPPVLRWLRVDHLDRHAARNAAMSVERVTVRRALGCVLVVSLCLAAAVAIVALTSGPVGDTDWRLVGTSLSLAAYGALAASGIGVRAREHPFQARLGVVTVALSAVSWVALLAFLWAAESDSDNRRTLWLVVSLGALACSHASAVLRARRAGETALISSLVGVSIVLAVVNATVGGLASADQLSFDEDARLTRLIAATVVLLVLTTALPPLVRRLLEADTLPPASS